MTGGTVSGVPPALYVADRPVLTRQAARAESR